MNDKNLSDLDELLKKANEVKDEVSSSTFEQKNKALKEAAQSLNDSRETLKSANDLDMEDASKKDLLESFIDRLKLNEQRIDSMISGINKVIDLKDPVGQMSDKTTSPSGFLVSKMRVPLGVIGIIYESRPNVTADASALCLKSGNVSVLRGGSEAINSNKAIEKCMIEGLLAADMPKNSIQLLKNQDRALVAEMIKKDKEIDLIIPRGGKNLIEVIAKDSSVPVLKHYDGLCHVYIDEKADFNKAKEIALNAKTYRYGICGAMETLLISEKISSSLVLEIIKSFEAKSVEIRGCEQTCKNFDVSQASEEDWTSEYLAPILSIKIVKNVDEAIAHINFYGSGHTDCIVTEDEKAKDLFLRKVDSSSVMHNLPTCFADGFEYGLGAEVGISTDKLHARGPVGLEGLTSEKFIVEGNGQIRA
ncbi:MAG: glutamate-5-semialdehyde dehydrogenase [Pseudomonadota bacterium]|jgi:glutamate-5-semialdehyde dehydrogenase|nr:glutamate-5-semialdehyde dehydrogenase [Pseudomonadota bacterium]MEC7787557.1 glutamate-5-semialdehyde dehydrogenase [Pseudomonadota bacterium]MEC8108772.1 glutamate-5-semialdehyde dehydrogenase [Pseudomonadota bacterium]MEC8169047.1 glutamate-5-semialdehyde dehydrogenase [Pseudomonadota bacterium]MEC9193613.1 glutamate-5-semialdehyde dehydrogenase [Pseudomonadota bacterium]|tara:strand:- start:1635 stop:2894 length:1260 start_codon:yes stop_codon:yes gene_type:complete